MKISRTTSLPIDPSLPSILDFPVELRVLIYELLLKRDGPLFIHDREALCVGRAQEAEREEEDAEFRHGLGAGVNLIATCRQIYFEASDTLYGQNDFVCSRVLSRHRRSPFVIRDPKQTGLYDQFVFAGIWPLRIGQSLQFLRQIKIDVDALCRCMGGVTHDVLPLLKLKWNTLSCNVEFIHTGRSMGCRRSGLPAVEEQALNRAVVMNNLLHTLGEQDPLGIRKYYKHYRRLKSIEISLHTGMGVGSAGFSDASPWGTGAWGSRERGPHRQPLNVCSDGKSVEWVTNSDALYGCSNRAMMLLNHIRFTKISELIHGYAMYASGDCTIDIDERTAYGIDLSLMRVLPQFALPYSGASYHSTVHYALPRSCLTIAALYNPSRAVKLQNSDFEWKGVSFLCNEALYKGYLALIARRAINRGCAKIEMRIRDQPAEDIRIDLCHLDRLLIERDPQYRSSTELVIQCEETRSEGIIALSRAVISLENLRRHWFVYLTNLLGNVPQGIDLEELPTTPTHVNCHWNIISGKDNLLVAPPTLEEWRSFIGDSASAYRRVKARLPQKHEGPRTVKVLTTYWYLLEHTLLYRSPMFDYTTRLYTGLGDGGEGRDESLDNLFAIFP